MVRYKLTTVIDTTHETIRGAYRDYCAIRGITFERGCRCEECPLREKLNGKNMPCWHFVREYPHEAAELMGLEIVEGGIKK